MRVKVDQQRCIGSANCTAIAPTAFEMDARGKSAVRDATSVSEDKLREAAELCPTDAIILEDDAGRRLYP